MAYNLHRLLFLGMIFSVIFASVVYADNNNNNNNNLENEDIQEFNETFTQYFVNHFEELVDLYNQNFNQIPGIFTSFIGDSKINMVITMNDNSVNEFNIITQNGIIIESNMSLISKPDFIITSTEQALDTISNENNTLLWLKNSIANQLIIIRAETIIAKLKLVIINTFI